MYDVAARRRNSANFNRKDQQTRVSVRRCIWLESCLTTQRVDSRCCLPPNSRCCFRHRPRFSKVNISPRGGGKDKRRSIVRGLAGDSFATADGHLQSAERPSRHEARLPLAGNNFPDNLLSDEVGTSDGVAENLRHHNRNSENADGPGAGDLCLGMAVGTSPEQLVAFVASFHEVSPTAVMVLLLDAPARPRVAEIIAR